MKTLSILLVAIPLVLSLSPVDKTRIGSSFNGPLDSLKSAYQVTVARSILGLPLLESSCDYVAKNTQLTLDDLYYSSYISKIQGCQVNIAGIEEFLRSELNSEGAKVKVLFKASSALANFDLPLEPALNGVLAAALKSEESVMSHSLAYLSASLVPGDAPKDIVDSIEDIVHRADTIGSVMSFDGGLMETAMFLKGALALSEKAGSSALTDTMVKKFADYITSNKDKSGQSNLFYTLIGLEALANNKVLVPSQLIVLENSAVITPENPSLKLSLVDPLGNAIAGSGLSIDAGQSIFPAGKLSGSAGVFEVSASAFTRGIHKVGVSAQLPSGYVAPDVTTVSCKVVLPVVVADTLFKLIDVDDNRVMASSDLSSGPAVAKGDLSTRLMFDFSVKEVDGSSISLHQAFVRFTSSKTGQEVYFIAQADLNKKYSVDLNFRTAASKSFGSLAGEYSVDAILGDATLPSAMVMKIATFTLDLPESKEPAADLSKSAKPEISHTFRTPEKRPPQAISMLFTGLIFLPALVLLIVWAKLGANISGLSFSLSGLCFHGGLAAIFLIYLNFFIGTDMFTTVKYLSGCAIITFLAGQRLLSTIAAQKKAK